MSTLDPSDRPTHQDSVYIAEAADWRAGYGGHLVTWQLPDVEPFEYILTNLNGPMERYDVSTLRMVRHGGVHTADVALQQSLFTAIGAITVIAGHIEAEMKRIILVAEEGRKSGFAELGATWSGLEDQLWRHASSGSELAAKLRPALDWGRSRQVKEIRDQAVHSAWRLHSIGHIEACRFKHKSDGETLIDRDGSRLAANVETMFTYLHKLEDVVSWPTAVLPPLPVDAPHPTLVMEPVWPGDD